jgi:diguanylate cyclase (GGDEF)-like protein/PAS domain S-box-containing protein
MPGFAQTPAYRTAAAASAAGALQAVLHWTPDGAVIAASEAAAAMFGTTVEALVGRAVGELLTPVPRGGAGAPRHLARVTGSRANDVPFPVWAHVGIPPAGEAGTVCALREFDAADYAREGQRQFDAIFDHAPIGQALFDTDGRYVRVNRELCRMLGRTERELLGMRDQELTHPDDRGADVEVAWEILDGRRQTHQCEKRFVRPDGSVVWSIANLTFLRDAGGAPLMWVGQFQDVTARRVAEEAYRRERDVSQQIVDSMSDGFLLTRDGAIVAVNEALCRMTGFTRDELLGAVAPFPFIPPERREQTLALRDRISEAGGGEIELTVMRSDGVRFPAALTSAPTVGPDGRTNGFVSSLRDISERKRLERELTRRANRDPLTGLLNRAAFAERLDRELAAAGAHGRPISLALVDIDNFKAINDRHGHRVGDAVLAETAERLRTMSRTGDHIARVGGEEFAWLLPDTTAQAALQAAERARRAIEASVAAGFDSVTVSIGLCELAGEDSADELYEFADRALYRAKHGGRNRCVSYLPV